MIAINHHPSLLVLRWFGIIQSLALSAIGGAIYWQWESHWAALFWGVAIAFAFVYYCLPRNNQRWLCVGMQYLAYPLNALLACVLFMFLYFGLFTLVGGLLRLFGYDPLRRTKDPSALTYWQPHRTAESKKQYFRQF
jgi:hypothetical protein